MKRARSNWAGAILVCGKCSKKIEGGFGPKGHSRLAKALRGEPGFGKGRKAAIGVVETKCLGICPKAAVTVVDSRRPGEWLVVPEGADVAQLARRFRQGPDAPEDGGAS